MNVGYWIGFILALPFNMFVSPLIITALGFAPYFEPDFAARFLPLLIVDILVVFIFCSVGSILAE